MKTHWRKLDNPNYLGAYSLLIGDEKTKEITVTIERVITEKVKNERGEDSCRVAYFTEKKVDEIEIKPMILNPTNSKIIEKIYDTPYIEDWKTKKITIYVAKIKAFGDYMDALRIRETKVKKLPELLPGTKQWEQAIKYLSDGNPVENVEKKYLISPENRETLLTESI